MVGRKKMKPPMKKWRRVSKCPRIRCRLTLVAGLECWARASGVISYADINAKCGFKFYSWLWTNLTTPPFSPGVFSFAAMAKRGEYSLKGFNEHEEGSKSVLVGGVRFGYKDPNQK